MATVWEEFGIAVKTARTAKARNWTGKHLAQAVFGNVDRTAYMSQIERGATRLSAPTVRKLAHVLELPDTVTDPVLRADLPHEDKLDTDAKRLMQMAAADATAPKAAEALMVALAYDIAQGGHIELQTACTSLRNALQAAADMRTVHGADDRLSAVLRRVADLNDQGQRDAAGAALDAAIKAKEADPEKLCDAALQQDRLRNRPEVAARRLMSRLKASAPSGGVFAAATALINDIRERGEQQGDPYDLALALELAKSNLERAKGLQAATAQNDLGNCHLALGERLSAGGHLTRARIAFEQALQLVPKKTDANSWAVLQTNLGNGLKILGDRTGDPAQMQQAVAAYCAALTVQTAQAAPMEWATTQHNLGTTLQSLGKRTGAAVLLQPAVDAFRAALTVRTPQEAPLDWAATQHSLGDALCALGSATRDPALFDAAAAAYADCLTIRTRDDGLFLWAQTQWNLADLALARHALTPDPAHLDAARHHLAHAREVFSAEGNDHQLAECDRLQAQLP